MKVCICVKPIVGEELYETFAYGDDVRHCLALSSCDQRVSFLIFEEHQHYERL